MPLANPDLENAIVERLKLHIAGFAPIQALPSLNPATGSMTPSGQSQEEGLLLAVDIRGGTGTMATTGDVRGGGKDRLEIYVVLSASLWLQERAQAGDVETAQQQRDRVAAAVRTASGALRALVGTITTDPALPGDAPGYQGLWYNLTLGFPGLMSWVHYDAEGQFRQTQLGITLYAQQTRRTVALNDSSG